MTDKDRIYYRFRAEIETERAALANDRSAVRAHYDLAQAYFERIAPEEPEDEAA